MSIKWGSFQVKEPDGTISDIFELIQSGKVLEEGGIVQGVFVERVHIIKQGMAIEFTPHDLAEICWFWIQKAKSIVSSAQEYAQQCGITLKDVSLVENLN